MSQFKCSECGGEVYSVKNKTNPGLGTWHCINGCKPRLVKIVRPVFSGKEDEVGRGSDQVLIQGLNLQSEFVKTVTVRRPIKVV